MYVNGLLEDLKKIDGFDWDTGNISKNFLKHGVTNIEIEEIFFDKFLLIYPNVKHSDSELRFYCLGKTFLDRSLFVSFTIRSNLIRPISARDMSKKEREIYYEG